MTNGEKLDQIFPDGICPFSKNWLKEEYKPNKSEIPTGSIIDWNNCHTSEQLDSISTTKNDLGVDAISRADAIGSIAVECSAEKLDIDYAKFLMLRRAIKALPTVTPQEPFINKPCVSSGVCEHDKQKVLEKIRAEIEQIIGERNLDDYDFCSGLICARKIIDKYKAERNDK